MSSALDGLDGFNMELLRKNRFCTGKRRGRRYVCHGDADEDAKSKAVELLSEAINRMRRWRVWEAWWVVEWMDEWWRSVIGLRFNYEVSTEMRS